MVFAARLTISLQGIYQRCREGWLVVNTLQSAKIIDVFRTLALDAGCLDNTVAQLVNAAWLFSEEPREQQVCTSVFELLH